MGLVVILRHSDGLHISRFILGLSNKFPVGYQLVTMRKWVTDEERGRSLCPTLDRLCSVSLGQSEAQYSAAVFLVFLHHMIDRVGVMRLTPTVKRR